MIYVSQYYLSCKLPPSYNFKSIYNSQFAIEMLPIISRNILDLNYISNLLPWYYTNLVMYYLSTITIVMYHRKVKLRHNPDNPSIEALSKMSEG